MNADSQEEKVQCSCGWQGTMRQLKVNDSRNYCPSCLLPSNLKYNNTEDNKLEMTEEEWNTREDARSQHESHHNYHLYPECPICQEEMAEENHPMLTIEAVVGNRVTWESKGTKKVKTMTATITRIWVPGFSGLRKFDLVSKNGNKRWSKWEMDLRIIPNDSGEAK